MAFNMAATLSESIIALAAAADRLLLVRAIDSRNKEDEVIEVEVWQDS